MDDCARNKLCEILAQHGPDIAADWRRCKALLSDACCHLRKEISALIAALRGGVPAELLAGKDAAPLAALVERLAKKLHDHEALDQDASRWAVRSWAQALGLLEQLLPSPPPSPLGGTKGHMVVAKSGPADYRTIGEAIQAAATDAQILVRPGLYLEGLVLDRPVRLQGEGPVADIVVRSADSACLLMKTDRAEVRGLSLHCRAGASGKSFFAVDIPQGNLVLEDCDLTSDTLSCVGIHGVEANPVLRRCCIHDSRQAGVFVYDQGGGRLENCDIFSNMYAGVELCKGGTTFFWRCQIHDGKTSGVYVHKNGAGTLEECHIFGNAESGVRLVESCKTVFAHCHIYKNATHGIDLCDGASGEIRGCKVSDHPKMEIRISAGNTTALENNEIAFFPKGGYTRLQSLLRQKAWEKADEETKRIIRAVSGHDRIDSEKKARAMNYDLLWVLDHLWESSGGGKLKNRDLTSYSSGFTDFTGFWSFTTWVEWRLEQVGLA